MPDSPRYYLDHAATSWPKPPGSLEACIEYQLKVGSASGRGVYASAELASNLVRQTKQSVAKLIGARDYRSIGFGSNGTQVLNAALFGLFLSPYWKDGHVVTTQTEHNSVLRPLQLASQRLGVTWTCVPCDSDGFIEPKDLEDSITPRTKLIVINHASNVTGVIQDLASLAQIAKEYNVILMVDAAQTIGYLPIDVESMGISILAAPGHKGAGGMLGTGVLYVEESLSDRMVPAWIGGSGLNSDSLVGPFTWQEGLESGNANVPAIASLRAGVDWVLESEPNGQLNRWSDKLAEAILSNSALTLIGPRSLTRPKMPIVSLASDRVSCHELALLLDNACHVEARSGFHCAGLIHRSLGTHELGGTLRFSFGHTSSEADFVAAKEGIDLIAKTFA